MTRRFAGPFLWALFLCSFPSSAVQAQVPCRAVEDTIRAMEEQERVAVLKEDVPALEKLWAESLTVNNPQNEISPNRAAVLDRVKHGLIRYSQFDRRIEAIRVDGDFAIVMGSETVVRKDDTNSANPPVHRRFTNIWKKSGKAWRMIARQASVVPGS